MSVRQNTKIVYTELHLCLLHILFFSINIANLNKDKHIHIIVTAHGIVPCLDVSTSLHLDSWMKYRVRRMNAPTSSWQIVSFLLLPLPYISTSAPSIISVKRWICCLIYFFYFCSAVRLQNVVGGNCIVHAARKKKLATPILGVSTKQTPMKEIK